MRPLAVHATLYTAPLIPTPPCTPYPHPMLKFLFRSAGLLLCSVNTPPSPTNPTPPCTLHPNPRFQKLRKKAGLVVTDAVEVFYDVCSRDGAATAGPSGGAAADGLAAVVAEHAEYIRTSLGRPLLPLSSKPSHAVSVEGSLVNPSHLVLLALHDVVAAALTLLS